MDKKEYLELFKKAWKDHVRFGTRSDGENNILGILWKNEDGTYETLAEECLPPEQNLTCSIKWDETSQNWK